MYAHNSTEIITLLAFYILYSHSSIDLNIEEFTSEANLHP